MEYAWLHRLRTLTRELDAQLPPCTTLLACLRALGVGYLLVDLLTGEVCDADALAQDLLCDAQLRGRPVGALFADKTATGPCGGNCAPLRELLRAPRLVSVALPCGRLRDVHVVLVPVAEAPEKQLGLLLLWQSPELAAKDGLAGPIYC